MTLTHVCVGTKRGITGQVFAPDGTRIGRVFTDWKDAAGTYRTADGKRKRPDKQKFWTAQVWCKAGAISTLGTRHRTRASALRAIREFWEWYGLPHFWGPKWTTGTAVEQFKRMAPDLCAYKPAIERKQSAYKPAIERKQNP